MTINAQNIRITICINPDSFQHAQPNVANTDPITYLLHLNSFIVILF